MRVPPRCSSPSPSPALLARRGRTVRRVDHARQVRRRDDSARHPRLVRGVAGRARRVHRADRDQGGDPPGRRRRHDREPGDPHQGQPDRRRALRRRQHVPHACAATTASSSATARPRSTPSPSRCASTRSRRVTPDRLRRRVHQLRQGVVPEPRREGPEDARRTSPSPAYKGRLVVEDPSTSSPGLAFLLATDRRVRIEASGSSTGSSSARTTCRSSTAGSRRSTTSSAAAAAAGAARSSCRTRRARRRPCTSPTRRPTRRPSAR